MPKFQEVLAKRTGVLVVAALCVFVFYEVRHARALGVPTVTPLAYTGSLLTFGSPDNATHSMTLALFVAGSNDGGIGSAACSVAATVTCVNGQFTIPIGSCLSTVQQNPNLEVEVVVDGTAMGLANVTAVPYAIEAGQVSANAISGVVQIANGGTGSSAQNFVDLTTNQTIGGTKTFTTPVSLGAYADRVVAVTTTTSWTGIPGLTSTFTLANNALVQLNLTGLVRNSAQTGTDNPCYAGFRFVIDGGAPASSDPTWGDGLVGADYTTPHRPFVIGYAEEMTAGAHTVSVQTETYPGYLGCVACGEWNGTIQGYDNCHLSMIATYQ